MKILSLFAAFLLCVAAWAEEPTPAPVTSGTCGANLTWNYDTGTKTLTITGTGAMADYSENPAEWRSLSIDALVIGEGVTTVGDFAFDMMFCINSVSFPSTLTYIGDDAFRYARMTSVVIPEGVTAIGSYAFSTCTKLASVSLPSTLSECEQNIFNNCQELTQVTFASGIKAIDCMYMFNACNNLESVTIPAGVTKLGSGLFSNSGVKNIVIPAGVTALPDFLFSSCSLLESVSLPSTVESIGVAAFYGCKSLSSLTIPNGVTTIGDRAFADCSNLANIAIPSSLTTIKSDVFSMTKVEEVTLPASVTTLGDVFKMSRVKTVTILSEVPPTFEGDTDDPFYFGVSGMVVRVPYGSASAYVADPVFSKAESIIEFGGTAIKSTIDRSANKALKVVENGKVVIIRDGEKYDLGGARLK